SCHEQAHYSRRSLTAGALGYVSKSRSAQELLFALKEVGAGRPVPPLLASAEVPASEADSAQPRDLIGTLSRRELEVFVQTGRGLSAREIASNLCRSVKTIETY